MHPSPTAVHPARVLPQNRTALREAHFTYTLVPCPGLQGQLRGHGDMVVYPHKP